MKWIEQSVRFGVKDLAATDFYLGFVFGNVLDGGRG